MIKQVYLCRYNHSDSICSSLVTDNLDYALSIDESPSLATFDDLKQHLAASGEIFQGLLNTYEGIVKWMEVEDEPELSKYLIIKENKNIQYHLV
ncbi:hypothetical protein EDM57_04270 [Brevibacillus gelatini]|uniref:Uncharacterized protein n=1 Tax=Brevibacillus gelatini TaxID=1655277 RepID=A0A3M8B7E0_9BACL|nr:hypothetical protein [Brevibacillus gelatini]RNB59364.1 hypothetical protein EDM57_04270 [Brevibacillus gelatini]